MSNSRYKFRAWDPFDRSYNGIKRGRGWYRCQGYVMQKAIYHPFANKRGYVPEHRLVLENRMKRFLNPRKELVHHINGVKDDNSLGNLKLTSPIEHPKGHIGERNSNGQFITNEPIFQEIKIRLLNTSTGECRPYTLSELISKTYRNGQFKFRGRFTGLKDKNGVEIYEGDIVKRSEYLYPDDPNKETLLKTDVLFVEWSVYFASFRCYLKDYDDQAEGCAIQVGNSKIEVIGNIHQKESK